MNHNILLKTKIQAIYFQTTKDEWANLGINDDNADFVKVEEEAEWVLWTGCRVGLWKSTSNSTEEHTLMRLNILVLVAGQ